jgi:hypothetical protein
MLRVCIAFSLLSVAACISYPEVTTVDETRDAPVSPDGSAQSISLVDDLGLDAGTDAMDGGVSPHPERDARAGDEDPPDEPATPPDEPHGPDQPDAGKGKGKPPKKPD